MGFALAGGYAGWALGGPEPSNDVDFVVTQAEAGRAAEVLAESGLDVRQPPEDWLFKVYSDGALVDILFRLASEPVDGALLSRAVEQEVLSVKMPVVDATDLMIGKLAALNEHACDLSKVLPTARALREKIDWARAEDGDGVERHRRGVPVPAAPDRGRAGGRAPRSPGSPDGRMAGRPGDQVTAPGHRHPVRDPAARGRVAAGAGRGRRPGHLRREVHRRGAGPEGARRGDRRRRDRAAPRAAGARAGGARARPRHRALGARLGGPGAPARAAAGTTSAWTSCPAPSGSTPSPTAVDPLEASRVLWFDAFVENVDRSWRNPNLLRWHRDLWLIDHGACLYFHHSWARARRSSPGRTTRTATSSPPPRRPEPRRTPSWPGGSTGRCSRTWWRASRTGGSTWRPGVRRAPAGPARRP